MAVFFLEVNKTEKCTSWIKCIFLLKLDGLFMCHSSLNYSNFITQIICRIFQSIYFETTGLYSVAIFLKIRSHLARFQAAYNVFTISALFLDAIRNSCFLQSTNIHIFMLI